MSFLSCSFARSSLSFGLILLLFLFECAMSLFRFELVINKENDATGAHSYCSLQLTRREAQSERETGRVLHGMEMLSINTQAIGKRLPSAILYAVFVHSIL